jgi:hypothetical protein
MTAAFTVEAQQRVEAAVKKKVRKSNQQVKSLTV